MADPDKAPLMDAAAEGEDVEEVDVEEEEADPGPAGIPQMRGAGVAAELLQNPEFLAAVQGQLSGMIGSPSGYIQSLPKVVKRRIKALKKLQNDMLQIESKFYEEVHELECKYAEKYSPLYERRRDIVNGGIEPTDSDCDWPSDEEEEEELSESLQNKAKIVEVPAEGEEETEKQDKEGTKEDENPSGIPSFWLTIFKNVDMLADMVQEHDEDILKHLTDIKVKFSQSDPMGFTLEFYFEPNDYFSNTMLTKEYVMRSEPAEGDPFSFEGPEIVKCTGCKIDWKKGKNVTVKQVKKKQKHKGRGSTRTVIKTVQNDSFFNFFSPPEPKENEEEQDDDTETLLGADFEIGHFIRERVVPRAVLYFTGEALEEDEYEEEGEEEEDEDNAEYDEDNDPNYNPSAPGDKPQECKQQ